MNKLAIVMLILVLSGVIHCETTDCLPMRNDLSKTLTVEIDRPDEAIDTNSYADNSADIMWLNNQEIAFVNPYNLEILPENTIFSDNPMQELTEGKSINLETLSVRKINAISGLVSSFEGDSEIKTAVNQFYTDSYNYECMYDMPKYGLYLGKSYKKETLDKILKTIPSSCKYIELGPYLGSIVFGPDDILMKLVKTYKPDLGVLAPRPLNVKQCSFGINLKAAENESLFVVLRLIGCPKFVISKKKKFNLDDNMFWDNYLYSLEFYEDRNGFDSGVRPIIVAAVGTQQGNTNPDKQKGTPFYTYEDIMRNGIDKAFETLGNGNEIPGNISPLNSDSCISKGLFTPIRIKKTMKIKYSRPANRARFLPRLLISPNGDYVIVNDNVISIKDKRFVTTSLIGKPYMSMAVSPDWSKIAYIDLNQSSIVWKGKTNVVITPLVLP